MPRSPRVQYENAVYHVMARGNRREAIVRDDGDRGLFLETFDEACGRTGWEVFAWVLMDNHYHAVFRTPEPNFVAGMQWFLSEELNLKSAANASQQIRRFHREPEKLLPREVKQRKASRNVA